jgi:ABC-type bacteriocin/lantibiotic exporter with double-glycine peptidase domain
VPYIPQLEAVECGAACLAMVLAHHGHHAPLAEVREACAVSRDGVNALAILCAAENYGLKAEAYSTELEGLAQLPLPAILHWEFRHFVVLEKLDRHGGASILDPSLGRIRVDHEMLAKAFTGAVLVFVPGDALQPRPRQKQDLHQYRGMIRAHAGTLGQLVGLSLIVQMVSLLFPVGQQFLVDQVLVSRQESLLWGLAVALGLALAVQALLQYARGWVLDTLHTILDLRLLGDFMRHAAHLPAGFFFQRQPGDLLQRLESNRSLRSFVGSQVATAVLDAFLAAGYGVLMMVYHWQLGLLVVALGCGRALTQLFMRGQSQQVVAVELMAMSRAGGGLLESLSALETIRSVSAESVALRRWNDSVVTRANASLPRLGLENTTSQLNGLVSALGIAAVSAFAGYEVITGQISLGVFTALLTLQGLFLVSFSSLISGLEQWQHLGSHLVRLADVMDTEPEASGEQNANSLQGGIRLSGVGFRYSPSSPWVLREFSLEIRPGEKIAVVGTSGAGKSTLARLVLGLLIPTEGKIFFDGRELGQYDLGSLRSRMGVVLQNDNLLNDSVFNNISLGDPEIRSGQVRDAAQRSQIDHVIEALPEKYATRLGEDGMQLSGGERQRLCLARALVRQPAILLLDEATSALDAPTEARVHAGLASMGCTRIVIAHRLATVRDADRILVLDDGRLVQEGSYQSLSAVPGPFRNLLDALEQGHD